MRSQRPIVVIDPGHGGSAATGGSSPNNATGPNGLLEKNLTLDIARRIAHLLAEYARVILTRTSDANISLAGRARVARENHAAAFLSIHFNGFSDSATDGSEVWVAQQANQRSRDFARMVLDQILTLTAVRDRGVRQADLAVLLPERHSPQTAACLAEIAFLTNPNQAQRLESEAYREQIATALAVAVRQHLSVAVQQDLPAYAPGAEVGGWRETRGASLSNSARLEWVDLNLVTGTDGRPCLHYLTSGDPNRGQATFNLKVTSANPSKPLQNTSLKIRLASRCSDGSFRPIPLEKPDGTMQEGDFLTLRSQSTEDLTSRTIPLTLENSTLQRAYDPDEPAKQLEVELHWSEAEPVGWRHYYNRTVLAFYLFHPVEFLFDSTGRPDGEIRYNDPVFKDEYWLPLGQVFTATDRSPVTLNLTIQTNLSRSDSSQISITASRHKMASTGKAEAGSKTEASVLVEDLIKATVNAEEARAWNLPWNQSIAREFATNIIKSRSYNTAWSSSKSETVAIEAPAPGNIRSLYAYPVFKRTRAKVVYFGQANALGQAQNRRELENFPVLQLSHWGYISQDSLMETGHTLLHTATGSSDGEGYQDTLATGLGGAKTGSPPRPAIVLHHNVGDGGRNENADVLALKDRLIGLGFNWLRRDSTMDAATIRTIRLFQSIIAGHNSLSGDGRVDVPGTTYSWLQAGNAPRWQLMPPGSVAEGYTNDELADTNDQHDYGTDWLASTIRAAAADYRDTYLKTHTSAALLVVNDVSLPQGGDTPDHAGHETGLACDLKLPRTDGRSGGTTYKDSRYNRTSTRAILYSLRRQPLVDKIYFNDPTLIGEGLCTRLAGHDNHIHFQIKPPVREPAATTLGRGGDETAITADALIETAVQMAGGSGSLLPPQYVRQKLQQRQSNSSLTAIFDRALQAGNSIVGLARQIVREIERQFVLDPTTSSLDLLPLAQRVRYRNFAWEQNDFPGEPTGPNEHRARQMAADLDRIRPERRPNRGGAAVITEAQLTAWQRLPDNDASTFWKYTTGQMRCVPGQSRHRLNEHALQSFTRMATDARADGVTLTILSAAQPPANSRRAVAKSGNRAAVAAFSSHSLGLAVDFQMSHGQQNYTETTTRPMQNVVDMRRSPVHKWLFLRGSAYGWYPYQNEPWHWEYNPTGFRSTFFANWAGPVPGATTQAVVLAAQSVTVQFNVSLQPQPDKLSGWAGAMAMMVSFRRQQSITAEVLAKAVGRSLRTSYDWDMLETVKEALGFRDIPISDNMSAVPPPEDWYAWLRQYGPLWVSSQGKLSQAVVVRGLHGDLTPTGTSVDILNPWDTTQHFDGDLVDFHPPNFGRRADGLDYTRFASEFINISELANVGNWRVLYLPLRTVNEPGQP